MYPSSVKCWVLDLVPSWQCVQWVAVIRTPRGQKSWDNPKQRVLWRTVLERRVPPTLVNWTGPIRASCRIWRRLLCPSQLTLPMQPSLSKLVTVSDVADYTAIGPFCAVSNGAFCWIVLRPLDSDACLINLISAQKGFVSNDYLYESWRALFKMIDAWATGSFHVLISWRVAMDNSRGRRLLHTCIIARVTTIIYDRFSKQDKN